MNKFILLISICFFLGMNAMAVNLSSNLMFTAEMNGAQETPAVNTTAAGIATITLSGMHDSVWLNVNLTGLSGAVTGIHIHEGAKGVAGPVVINLLPFLNGNRVNALLTGSLVTNTLIAKLMQGMYYINAHTTANPNGEIRGQLMLESDIAFIARLDGAQETPPVTTSAKGLAVFKLSKHNAALRFSAVANGLSGAVTGVHLHSGAPGIAGPVVQNLMPFLTNNSLNGEVDPTAYLSALLSGNVYINFHTAANPNGEIRGQLLMTNHLSYFSMLNGAQETPPVTTNAMAVGAYELSAAMDTLWYTVLADGMSGAITGAHFHMADPGSSGNVVLDLSPSVSGNTLNGMVTGTQLTTAFISTLLAGHNYINLHTTTNPSGEIRGQVIRNAREGYTISMDGRQEVPAVVSTATGGGFVSMDSYMKDIYYSNVVNGLNLTASHFHKNIAGVAGPVIHDITSSFSNNMATGWWKSTDAAAFTNAVAAAFQSDSVYLNVHTAANANGEIRGQVLRSYTPLSASGIRTQPFITKAIYPNPAGNILNLSGTGSGTYQIFNTTGSVMMKGALPSSEIDISSLPSGIYFIRFDGQASGVTRLVKE
jgi:Cu/Zn superoxide dismutase